MLGKKEKSVPQTNSAINVIGEGTIIEGNLRSSGDLRIDGTVLGNVSTTSKCVLGISGKIVGNINAKSCDLSGTVNGNLVVSELLLLKSSGKVDGDIKTDKIVVENGGEFNGSCTMGNTHSNAESKNEKDGKEATA
ncbi:MAG: cytoskeletal protein CcmA (bactofilin family) [Bacteroidia bacterium]|jgi:cytoskeletal protein CcmA (bactofilin family)